MRHLPILRHGVVYRSLDIRTLRAPDTKTTLAEVSLANAGLIRRDARRPPSLEFQPKAIAQALERAAELLYAPIGLDPDASPMDLAEFKTVVEKSTGLSEAVITHQLALLAETLQGLAQRVPETQPAQVRDLAVVLPSNALAVNRAWLPAIALGARVALKPGAADPFTPHRLIAALIAGGIPRETFSIYPSDHETTGVLIGTSSRTQLFGDASVVERYSHDPNVQVNGPGRSAVILAAGLDWTAHLDDLIEGVCLHSGRSCLNTSSIVTLDGPETAKRLAEALAERLKSAPRVNLGDPAKVRAIAARVEDALLTVGAQRLSPDGFGTPPPHPSAPDQSSLAPTVIHCESGSHPLARIELPFPFVSVTSVEEQAVLSWLGPTLAVATLGVSTALERAIEANHDIERLCPSAPHSLSTSMAETHLERMRGLLS